MFSSMKALAVLVVSWMPFSAEAVNPVFKFGEPTYFGSGCPNASIEIVSATDAQSVSLMFSKYSATTSKSLTRDRKTCDLSVPVELLPGITIGIFKTDYRGYAYVPDTPSAYLEFSASYFFAGSQGPSYKKRWNAGTDEDVFISNNLTATAIAWSPCKPSTILRINTAIIASKPTLQGQNPSIAIDTTDITIDRGIEFFLTYKKC